MRKLLVKSISRAEAKAKGLTRYYTGRLCAHGHVAERHTANSTCSVCFKRIRAGVYERNKSEIRRRSALYRKLNPAQLSLQQRRWRKANPDKARNMVKRWRLANPERHKATERALRALHPEWGKAANAARRVAERANLITAKDIRDLFTRQAGVCVGYACGVSIKGAFHLDHKTPICRDGKNVVKNAQLLCAPCNLQKGRMTNSEWVRFRKKALAPK